nr:hypothetical protein BaRGS_035038 [Batillaria attramentaria]
MRQDSLQGAHLVDLLLTTDQPQTTDAGAVADSLKLINDLLYFCTILLLRTDDEMGNKAYGYLYKTVECVQADTLTTILQVELTEIRAPTERNSSRHRVTVMMIIVILVFLVCITPDVIMSTVFGLGYTEANNLVKGVREFSDTLLAINAATNFIIYCLFNKMFLQSCKNLFCKTTVTKKWQTELDESQYKRLSEKNNSNNNGSPPRL